MLGGRYLAYSIIRWFPIHTATARATLRAEEADTKHLGILGVLTNKVTDFLVKCNDNNAWRKIGWWISSK